MPPEILATINEALEQYQGDKEKVAAARHWLEAIAEADVEEETKEEMAEVKIAIASSETEDRHSTYHTHEAVNELFEKESSTIATLRQFLGTWEGHDLEELTEEVYRLRSKAKF